MQVRDLISDDYRTLLRKMREVKPDFGTYGHKNSGNVAEFAASECARSILDYGSGSGSLAQQLRRTTNHDVFEYDPAFHDDVPHQCGMVACVDVLEHVEPDKLDAVLDHIWELARQCAYLAISNAPARAVLPDGRNAHLIVESPHWWMKKLQKYEWSPALPAQYRPAHDVVFWLRKERARVSAAA